MLSLIGGDLQLWKLSKDGKLINKAHGQNWKHGSETWVIEDDFIINQDSKKVMSVESVHSNMGHVKLTEKLASKNSLAQNELASQKWEFMTQNEWMMIKNTFVGPILNLTASRCGTKLTVQYFTITFKIYGRK